MIPIIFTAARPQPGRCHAKAKCTGRMAVGFRACHLPADGSVTAKDADGNDRPVCHVHAKQADR